MLSRTDQQLRGAQLTAARLFWLAAALAVLALVAATVPDILLEASTVASPETRTFSQLTPAEAQILAGLGISPAGYAAYVLGWMLSPVLFFTGVSAILFLRHAEDRAAFRFSLMLLAIGIAVLYLSGITRFRAEWQPAVDFIRALGAWLLLMLLYIFPSGQFVPRWTRFAAALWAAWMVYWLLFPRSPFAMLDFGGALTPAGLVGMVLGFGAGVYAQVYRFRRVSTAMQRQQARVFALGFGGMFGLYVMAVVPYFALPAVRAPGWPYTWYGLVYVPLLTRLAFALVPLMIAFAILRYRLWDVELIVRRTLLYGVLTAVLAAGYAVTIIGLELMFFTVTGQVRSQAATVLSTLVLAALARPFYGRAQAIIDRRFYRRDYDAARALAEFSHSVVDEVDVDRLTERLAGVVDHALKPAHISVWLTGAGEAERQDVMSAREPRSG